MTWDLVITFKSRKDAENWAEMIMHDFSKSGIDFEGMYVRESAYKIKA